MNNESPWFKKVLSEIRETDKTRQDMERHFSYESLDDYKELNRREAVEAVELLKCGVENHIRGDSVILIYEDEKFKVPKEALRDELGTEQYNFLVNNVDEVDESQPAAAGNDMFSQPQDAGQPDTMTQPPQNSTGQTPDIRLPDGRKVPAALAPMMLFSQAMEQTISLYMGGQSPGQTTGYGLVPQPKVKSKTTAELLKNLADLQQQVLLIEEEKEKASSGSTHELEELRALKKSLEDRERDAQKQIDALEKTLADTRHQRNTDVEKVMNKLKETTETLSKKNDELAAKEKELSDVQTMVKATQTQITGLKRQAETESKAAEERMREAVQTATEAAQKDILDQKKGEIESLEADYRTKLEDLKEGYERDISDAKQSYEDRIKSLEDENRSEKTKADELSASMQSMSSDKEKALADLRAGFEKQLEELKESHSKELTELKDSHSKEIDRIKSEKDSAEGKAKSDLENRYRSQIDELEKKKKAAESEADRYKNQAKDLQGKIDTLHKDLKSSEDAAFTDLLTGVKNDKALNRDVQNDPPKVAARVSILGMKSINEENGIEAGNDIIIQVADSLNRAFGGRVYRTMGDQFTVFPRDMKQAEKKISSIRGQLLNDGIYIAYGTGHGDNALADAMEGMREMHDEIYAPEESDGSDEDEETSEDVEGYEDDEPEEDADESSDDGSSEEDDAGGTDGDDDDSGPDDDSEELFNALSEGEEI